MRGSIPKIVLVLTLLFYTFTLNIGCRSNPDDDLCTPDFPSCCIFLTYDMILSNQENDKKGYWLKKLDWAGEVGVPVALLIEDATFAPNNIDGKPCEIYERVLSYLIRAGVREFTFGEMLEDDPPPIAAEWSGTMYQILGEPTKLQQLKACVRNTKWESRFDYSENELPIVIRSKNYIQKKLCDEYSSHSNEVTLFLRLSDNPSLKDRMVQASIATSELVELLEFIEGKMTDLSFNQKLFVRDSWTGRLRAVISANGIEIIHNDNNIKRASCR